MTTPTPETIQAYARRIASEYNASRKNHYATFITAAQNYGKVPGLSQHKAMLLAQELAPGSYRDYLERQNRGEKLPVLFPPKREFAERVARAALRGGIIN